LEGAEKESANLNSDQRKFRGNLKEVQGAKGYWSGRDVQGEGREKFGGGEFRRGGGEKE